MEIKDIEDLKEFSKQSGWSILKSYKGVLYGQIYFLLPNGAIVDASYGENGEIFILSSLMQRIELNERKQI